VAILPLIDQGQGHHMGPDFKVKIKDLRNHITRYLADLIIQLESSLRYKNVFGLGKVFGEFAVRVQHSVKPNRNRIYLWPEIAGLEIRQQTPQNPIDVSEW
jgi:hypothetical protein